MKLNEKELSRFRTKVERTDFVTGYYGLRPDSLSFISPFCPDVIEFQRLKKVWRFSKTQKGLEVFKLNAKIPLSADDWPALLRSLKKKKKYSRKWQNNKSKEIFPSEFWKVWRKINGRECVGRGPSWYWAEWLRKRLWSEWERIKSLWVCSAFEK